MTRIADNGPVHGRRRLPQLLTPDRYYSPQYHDLEMDRLFRPAWHCIGLRDDIPHEGDYFTLDHLNKPLLIQNQGDRIAVFHNICAHRNALLARKPHGNMSRIKCGYHGWEYNRDGVACMIPGGEYFKPMSPMEFALDRIRVEMLGPLIFVALEDKTPPLREFLGTWMWSRLEYTFSANMRPVATWTVDYECNWKVLVENTLEDYHVTSVHFATVGATPPYKQIIHTMDEKFITYENCSPSFDSPYTHWLTARIRPDAEFTYFQYFGYPSLIFASTPMSSHLHLLIPTSSTTCRMRIALFLPGGGKRLLNRLLCKTLSWPATRLSKRFVEEDRTICNDVQRGIANARFEGVLGCREERVHAFQEYVLANCDSLQKRVETGV